MSVAIPPSDKSQYTGTPVRMKMRTDLTFAPQSYQGVEFWVVKEPLGQKYFQFPPSVFYLLQELDGYQTIDELQDKYHKKFAPKRITRQDLQQLLTRFHNDGLVTSDVGGQGAELLKRGEKNTRMERFQTLSNVLAIRYRGFDPVNPELAQPLVVVGVYVAVRLLRGGGRIDRHAQRPCQLDGVSKSLAGVRGFLRSTSMVFICGRAVLHESLP